MGVGVHKNNSGENALHCIAMFKAIIITIRININVVRTKAMYVYMFIYPTASNKMVRPHPHLYLAHNNVQRAGARTACDAISMTLFGLCVFLWFLLNNLSAQRN